MNCYLDTSVIVALVLRDPHTTKAEGWLERAAPACIVSDFCAIEFASVVSRQVNMSHLSAADGSAALDLFDAWIVRTAQVVASSGEHMEAAGRMVATSIPSYPHLTRFTSRSRNITDWYWRLSTSVSVTPRAAKASRRSYPNSEMLMSKLKSIPAFKTEAEEKRFWETHDSADYVDWSKAQRVRLPNLKPSTTAISIRLPLGLLEQVKIAANKRDAPYQSLIKMWLAEKVG
jgi:predicted DNA binding CopG/RHH family protein/uncharacterized protein with PIN domain